jgi:hypothetical protein
MNEPSRLPAADQRDRKHDNSGKVMLVLIAATFLFALWRNREGVSRLLEALGL